MKTRTTIITIATLAVLALGATAFAGPGYGRGGYGCPGWGAGAGNGMGPGYGMGYGQGGRGYGMGPGMMYGQGGPGYGQQLTPEQYEKVRALSDEYGDKAEALNKKLYAKDAELDAAYAAEKIDAGKVKSLAKELGDLRSQIFQLRAEFRAKLISEGVIDARHGRRGPGFGQGPGFGPGSCPGFGPGFGQGPGPEAFADDNP